MSIKQKIEEKLRLIQRLEEERDQNEDKITDLKKSKIRAQSDQDFGIGLMSSSSMRPLGAYEYLSGSQKVSAISSDLKDAKERDTDITIEIAELESDIAILRMQYDKIPESNLVAKKDGIYIQGDKSNYDILVPLRNSMEAYAKQHEATRQSKDIQEFEALKAKLIEYSQTHNLSNPSTEVRRALYSLEYEYNYQFQTINLDGKYFISWPTMRTDIMHAKSSVREHNQHLQANQNRRDKFKPSFWGKIFKGVREKEEKRLESSIEAEDVMYKFEYGDDFSRYEQLSAVKETLVDPTEEIHKEIERICTLKETSKEVQDFLFNRQKYSHEVSTETIFKDMGVKDVGEYILKLIQPHLDDHDLKVSKEKILETIYASKYHTALAEQIQAHMGHTSPPQNAAAEKEA